MVIGIISGLVGWYGYSRLSHTLLKGYDDALDVFTIHDQVGNLKQLSYLLFHLAGKITGGFQVSDQQQRKGIDISNKEQAVLDFRKELNK